MSQPRGFVLGSNSVVGDPRRKWEDRVFVGEISRDKNDKLIVGIVADGVGNADLGSAGAQRTIDVVIETLGYSHGNNIPLILSAAIERANTILYQDNQRTESEGLTTIVVAIIFRERCYIANVGDSRAYWVQDSSKNENGKLLQLTRDHTYYNTYGGDPDSEDADILVNAIGKKPQVKVDLGLYLKGNDYDAAYLLGKQGLPLKPGDTIMLCSDGLIKSSPQGVPYIKESEIHSALRTEIKPDMAAIKIVSAAEGRRPDDNVSAVTIQYLSDEIIEQSSKPGLEERLSKFLLQNKVIFAWASIVLLIFMGLMVIGLSYWKRPSNPQLVPVEVIITATTGVLPTATQHINTGDAVVLEGFGPIDSKLAGTHLISGELIDSDQGLKIAIGEENGTGIIYLFENSSASIIFDDKLHPILNHGAIYVQPGGVGWAEVHFNDIGIYARVIGSRMIVEMTDTVILLYCFEGDCEWKLGNTAVSVPAGSKLAYRIGEPGIRQNSHTSMSTSEILKWNQRCNYCIGGVPPTPTPVLQGGSSSGDNSEGDPSSIDIPAPGLPPVEEVPQLPSEPAVVDTSDPGNGNKCNPNSNSTKCP